MVLSCIFELKPLFLIHSKDLIKEYLDSFFINKLSDETVKSKLPAYQPVTTFARGKFINEGEISALTVEMKVNNCRDRLSQGRDRSRFCPFCPGLMASEFNVAWICPRLSTLRRDIGINQFFQKPSAVLEIYLHDVHTGRINVTTTKSHLVHSCRE